MSLSNALSNAVSGMTAASRRAEITSHNIANATTEGYARQGVELSMDVTAGRGSGVRVESPERVTNPRLTASRREADTDASGSQVQATAARAIADVFQGPDSLFEAMAALENSLRSVSETPESSALQERVVSNASQVVTAFNDISNVIQAERTGAESDIEDAVYDVNTALSEIESLNKQITLARLNGGDPTSFEQLRDGQIDIVAENLPVRIMGRDSGQIALFTDTGVALVDGRARELEFERVSFVTADMDYRAGGSPLSGLTVDGIDLSPKAGLQSVTSGKIAGLFEIRDGSLVDTIAEVDAVAADLVGRFETDGAEGADGRGLFIEQGIAALPPGSPGLAGRLALNERIDPDQGGAAWRIRDGLDAVVEGSTSDSSYASVLLGVMTAERVAGASLSRAGSAAGLAADLGSLFEQRGQTFENIAAGDLSRLSTLQAEETGAIGVDIDNELQGLILIEQAYGANAKVIEVADRLVQRLLEI